MLLWNGDCVSEADGHQLSFILLHPSPLLSSLSAVLCSCLLTGPLRLASSLQSIHHIPVKPMCLHRPRCPQDGTPFISTLTTHSCPPRIPCSVSQDFPWFPEQAVRVPSRLKTWLMLLSPSSTCLHSQLLVGTQPRVPSSRNPSQPCEGLVLSVALCHTAYLWNCSRLPSARQSFCHWGSHVQVQSCHHGRGLAAMEGPLPGMGGRNHEAKVGYLCPPDPVISRIFLNLGFRMFQIINPGTATSFSPLCQESPRPSTHQ